MPIKFGLLTNPANNILEEIKLIKKLGFDYVEIGIEPPCGAPEIILRNRQEIIALIRKFNSCPVAHTPWWIDLGSNYPQVRKAWIEEAKRSIDVSKALNIDKINFHFYSLGLTRLYLKSYQLEILNNIITSLKEVVNYATSKEITVIYENADVKREILGIKEYKFVVDSVPKLKVHLDVGHAFVENGLKGIRDYLFTFRNKLEHIHIHDNQGEEDEHLPLGEGKINFEQVAKWLNQINYDKTITFEVFTSKKDARNSMLKFKEYLKKI
ncbi:MAG: sugar phosphate isomerase/epimerase family protein [Candidatus Aenigmatarchaeota archaeon]|nr:sugar phosphate isomerase/epimerase [Candidatus Aenigmarchaeota archaeon]